MLDPIKQNPTVHGGSINKQALGGRPILFVCPQCGGEHFGRDTADDGLGGVKILRTVRCHTPGCGWRGEWPPRQEWIKILKSKEK
jgi:predicted RNA-binding Zn-ribbon protein involved in translation (DUF1610 family)